MSLKKIVRCRLQFQDPKCQGAKEAAEHLTHELWESRPSESVVKGLVRHHRFVLVVELTQEVGERLDLGPSQCCDDRQEKPEWCHLAQTLALASLEAELVPSRRARGQGRLHCAKSLLGNRRLLPQASQPKDWGRGCSCHPILGGRRRDGLRRATSSTETA